MKNAVRLLISIAAVTVFGTFVPCELRTPIVHAATMVPGASNPGDAADCEKPTVSTVKRVGPAKLYPKASLTTGCADTLDPDDLTARYTDNCPHGKTDCTYSQSHRSVSSADRKEVYDKYRVVPGARNIHSGEVDHLYPLCAGGANDGENLWYQPAANIWKGKNYGYHEKDQLEALICKQIVAGTLDPKVAFQKITQDWVKFYQEQGLDTAEEGDDEDVD